MKGLTGSEILILLALYQKPMSAADLDELMKKPPAEPRKTTTHWASLLADKKLITRESETVPILSLTREGKVKAEEAIYTLGPHIPAPVALI